MILLPFPGANGSGQQAGGAAGAGPWGAPLPHDMALAFGPQGFSLVRVSLIDTASMACTASWWVTEDGDVRDAAADHDIGFAGPMATIVHHQTPGAHETVTRRLTPHQWGFGWHADGQRTVVVAEVQYREAHDVSSDIDVAMVRMLCDACIHRGDRPSMEAQGASDRAAARRAMLANVQARHAVAPAANETLPPSADEARVLPQPAAPRRRLLRGWRRWLAGACAVVLAGLGIAQWQHSQTLASESQRLKAQSETTLVQTVATALEHGDYGELQSELDHFERLHYFDAALVVNAQGKVVSRSGAALGVRIGELLAPQATAGSRAVALRDAAGRQLGQLHIWTRAGR